MLHIERIIEKETGRRILKIPLVEMLDCLIVKMSGYLVAVGVGFVGGLLTGFLAAEKLWEVIQWIKV